MMKMDAKGFGRAARLLILLLLLAPAAASAGMELTASAIPQGGVALFFLTGDEAAEGVRAQFDGGEVFIASTDGSALGIVAVDVDAPPGVYTLRLESRGMVMTRSITVRDGGFETQRLTLPKGYVELDAPTLERVKAETGVLGRLWSTSNPEPLWSGPFIMPAAGELSSPFGTRRVLNGRPRSPHSGVDIAAPAGAPVVASNGGRVALTGDFFFIGRFVVIDHGLGVFTLYAHLSEVTARPGEAVERGETIGAVGSTGRATGPHLHFSMRVGGARVSPLSVFKATKRLERLARR